MNYYEELAVSEDASLDEIRRAYRALARLVHPDNQSDPLLRSVAERQMSRLNAILEVLSKPEKRRAYDASLGRKQTSHTLYSPWPAWRRLPQRHWPWIAACGVLFAAGLFYLGSEESGAPFAPASPLPERELSAPPDATIRRARPSLTREKRANRKSQPRSRSQTTRTNSASISEFDSGPDFEPSPPLDPFARPEVIAGLSDPASGIVERPNIQAVGPAPATPSATQRATNQAGVPVFAGRWLYSPRTLEPQTPGLYPPEFIELFLSEAQGTLSGQYWARYRISDRPVSPEVRFRVFGALASGSATLNWVSDDGARGQLQMELHSLNSLEVTWWTSVFGRHMALTSGTALLLRQQVP
jgi:curved DNA-binding protein CbpA